MDRQVDQRILRQCAGGLRGWHSARHVCRPSVADAELETPSHTSLVLTRGGVILYPEDTMQPSPPGRISLMYEANPIAFLIEQAGGEATTGRGRILEVRPRNLQSRTPLIFGSRDEVRRIIEYHHESDQGLDREYTSPLFNARGLFSTL